ncbi:hypothetical protein FO519_004563 [Halicephalobus sp. NKZ332]|nr:hypothetical protein FO519_004563 [Halicephalobus sp. NKZ332]
MDFYCSLKDGTEVKEYYHGHGYAAIHIGQPIGQRIAVRKCGFGAFSTAWLCYNVERQKFTVLKILRADCTPDLISAELRVVKRIQAEMKVNYAHRGCNRILEILHNGRLHTDYYNGLAFDEFGPRNSTHYFIESEAMGGNLRCLMRMSPNQKLSVNSSWRILNQVFEGVGFLYKRGLIHCDLKPENILFSMRDQDAAKIIREMMENRYKLDTYRTTYDRSSPRDPSQLDAIFTQLLSVLPESENRKFDLDEFIAHPLFNVKITDLGTVVKARADVSYELGTFPYRPPESLLQCPITPTFDCWSMGIVALELITGKVLVNFSREAIPEMTDVEMKLGQLYGLARTLGAPDGRMFARSVYRDYFFHEDGTLRPNKWFTFTIDGGIIFFPSPDVRPIPQEQLPIKNYRIAEILKDIDGMTRDYINLVETCLKYKVNSRSSAAIILKKFFNS